MEAPFRALASTGVTDAMRGHDNTTFSDAEQRRCWLCTLHRGLVMQTGCAYRAYPDDDILVQACRMVARALDWLGAHA